MPVIIGKNSWKDDDSLLGTDAADTIRLLLGNDSAWGAGGADLIGGGYGDDQLSGGDGNDKLSGDYGNDRLIGDDGRDTLHGGAGNDDLYGGGYYLGVDNSDDLLDGGGGDDRFYGGLGADIQYGGSGDDTFELGTLHEMRGDKVYGGSGTDLLKLDLKMSAAAVTFAAKDFSLPQNIMSGATIVGIEEYQIRGTDLNDSLSGWLMDDTLQGGLGNDKLGGGGGHDELYGGSGSDTLRGGSGNDRLYGDETGYYDWSETRIDGADLIFAGFGSDMVAAGGGNDTVWGENGRDALNGQDGNDRLDGAQGNDTIEGGAGGDVLSGGNGDDWLYSYTLAGSDDGTEADNLDGGAGSDEIWVGVGDAARGGDVQGTVDLVKLTFGFLSTNASQYGVGVTYNLSEQGQTLTTLANGTRLDGFERLNFEGGTGADRVTGGGLTDDLGGGGGDDILNGRGGNDVIDGGAGRDVAYGGAGDDTFSDYDAYEESTPDRYFGEDGDDVFNDGMGADFLSGGNGADTFHMGAYMRSEDFLADRIEGGAQFDSVDYADADGSVYIDLTDQTKNAGVAVGDRFSSIERVEGSAYDDTLRGNGGNNALHGGARDDVVNGRGGNDMLAGGSGADDLTGGAGADTFVLENTFYTSETYWPHDVIRDFTRGSDKLAVLDSEFGVEKDEFRFVNQASNVAQTKGPIFIFETDTHRMWFDEDGLGIDTDGNRVIDENVDPILVATLLGVGALQNSDFSFYEA